jgi:RHS repeat-associated protein
MNNVCGSPCWAASYIYMNGALAAEYKNSTTYFVEPDHLGSTRIVTGMGQSVVEALDYLPFGELNSSDPGYTTHEFTGDQHDSEASLDHTWFRKYSPAMAHWMTPDPSGLAAVDASNPQSWNRYTYALNDPCALVDPLGLDTCKFNIGVYANQLSQTQLKALQNSLAAIFNAAGVGVNFSFSGNADFSFSVVPSGTPVGYQINGPSGSNGPLYAPAIALGSDSGFNPSTNTAAANHGVGFFDGVFGFYGISATSTEVGSILGRIGAHEAGHYLLNMLHNTPFQSLYGHLMDQNVNLQDPTVSFTPNQATQLQHRCEKLHGNGPGSAGGGGSAGGPANGGGGFIWVWAHISCTYLGTGSWACTTTYTPVL